jgi:hypothetical protein
MAYQPPRLFGCFGALLLVLVGIGTGTWIFSAGLGQLDHALTRLDAPGEHELALGEPGVYRVYLERPIEGTSREELEAREHEPAPAELVVSVREVSDAAQIPVRDAAVEEAYYLKGHAGHAILEFTAPRAGRYELSISWVGEDPPDFSLALAHEALPTLMTSVFLGMTVIVVAGLAGGGLGLWLLSRGPATP